jgi:hypothetical protein
MTTQSPRECRCCRKPIPIGMLACRKHWFDLPQVLRNAILITYRGGDREAYVLHVREADRIWRELGELARDGQ